MKRSFETHPTTSGLRIRTRSRDSSYTAKAFAALKSWVSTKLERQKSKVVLRELLELDDRNLRDIGITRDDIKFASRLDKGQTKYLETQRLSRITRDMRSNF